MKALKIFGITIGSLVVLALIVVGIAWVLISLPSGIASEVTSVTSSAEAAAQLDLKWTEFQNSVTQAEPGTEVRLALTQEEVNSKINQELKTVELPSGFSIGSVNVNLVDGKILLAADVTYSVFKGQAGLEASVEIVNGDPSIVVTDVDMGKLPIPQALKDQLEGLIPEGGVIQLSGLPLDMQNIQIVNGQLIIMGVTK